MADLLDIAPSTAVVAVWLSGGQRIVVHGLNVPTVAAIVARFPNIAGLLLGGISAADIGQKFILQFGEACGPIIAAGCGEIGSEKHERYASTAFNLEDQLRLITAIVRATCPNGFGFFGELMAKFGKAGEGAKKMKVRLRPSPSPSQRSSEPDFRQIMQ